MSALTMGLVAARTKNSDLKTIRQLNLWGCGINDISICKNMSTVQILAFTGNEISSLAPLKNCLKLKELYLRNNNIQNLKELDYLKNLPHLEVLCFLENPCCQQAGDQYRQIVLSKLPRLKKLDNIEVSEEEVVLFSSSEQNQTPKEENDQIEEASNQQPITNSTTSQQRCELTNGDVNEKDVLPNSTIDDKQTACSKTYNADEMNQIDVLLNTALADYQEIRAKACITNIKSIDGLAPQSSNTPQLKCVNPARISDSESKSLATNIGFKHTNATYDDISNELNRIASIESAYKRCQAKIFNSILLLIDTLSLDSLKDLHALFGAILKHKMNVQNSADSV